MLTYAGVPLIAATAELRAFAATHLPTAGYAPQSARAWPGPGMANLAWPTTARPAAGAAIGRLRWPTGASRWASAFYLADAEAVDAIRPRAYGTDGTAMLAAELRICTDPTGTCADDATGPGDRTLVAPMYLADVRPLSGIRGVNGLYLLHLVDDRWFWRYRACPALAVGAGATWSGVLDDLAAAIGITLDYPAIDPAYGSPGESLDAAGYPASYVLDAALYNVGLRLARSFDGACAAVDPTTALATRDVLAALYAPMLRAGGDLFAET